MCLNRGRIVSNKYTGRDRQIAAELDAQYPVEVQMSAEQGSSSLPTAHRGRTVRLDRHLHTAAEDIQHFARDGSAFAAWFIAVHHRLPADDLIAVAERVLYASRTLAG